MFELIYSSHSLEWCFWNIPVHYYSLLNQTYQKGNIYWYLERCECLIKVVLLCIFYIKCFLQFDSNQIWRALISVWLNHLHFAPFPGPREEVLYQFAKAHSLPSGEEILPHTAISISYICSWKYWQLVLNAHPWWSW